MFQGRGGTVREEAFAGRRECSKERMDLSLSEPLAQPFYLAQALIIQFSSMLILVSLQSY